MRYNQGVQRTMIGGVVHPFDNQDPLGKALADSIEQGAGDAVKGVVDWYQRSSADQAGYGDDLLRLLAGGVRNTTKAWQDATAEQEGIGDDILRGVGWTAGKGMQVLDAGSYYGGKVGGRVASMLGVDARIGGAAGNIIGDVLAGGAVAKIGQVGKTTSRLRKLRSLDTPDMWIEGAAKGRYSLAHGEKPTGLIDDFATAVTATGRQHKAVKALEKGVVGPPRYLEPVSKIVDDKTARTGNLKLLNKPYTKEQKTLFNRRRDLQSSGPFAHHHMLDVEFSGAALNRTDFDQIAKELNKYGIKTLYRNAT